MALESATYIDGLVTTNPTSTDVRSQGDDHLRLIKTTLKGTFPNVTGVVSPTHTELSYVDGVTSAIQTQIDAKANIASPALTGAPTAPTPATTDNDTSIATTAFVQSAIDADVTVHAALRPSSTVFGHAKIYVTGTTLYIKTS